MIHYFAIAVTLGLSIASFLFCFSHGMQKKLGLMVFGASMPWLIFYVGVLANVQLPASGNLALTADTMWLKSLAPYIASVLLALILFTWVRKPLKSWQHFALGLISAVPSLWLFLVL